MQRDSFRLFLENDYRLAPGKLRFDLLPKNMFPSADGSRIFRQIDIDDEDKDSDEVLYINVPSFNLPSAVHKMVADSPSSLIGEDLPDNLAPDFALQLSD